MCYIVIANLITSGPHSNIRAGLGMARHGIARHGKVRHSSVVWVR
jgi:hypothetical protein